MVKGAKKSGRVSDKWRDKQWVVINAPPAFGGGPLNYVPITDTNQAKGRVIENTMYNILKQDPHSIKQRSLFKLTRLMMVRANIFKGHEYAKEFLRSLVRRGSSMINDVHDYTTMDGYTFRVTVVAFSQRRVNTSKKHEIRMIARNMLIDKIPKLTMDQFVQETTMGKMSADLLAEAKKVATMRHIGIKKTKLISTRESRAIEEAKPIEATTATDTISMQQEVEEVMETERSEGGEQQEQEQQESSK